jgi:FKBP-type peptidyl-prolyl cis-trans isomerase SlyD
MLSPTNLLAQHASEEQPIPQTIQDGLTVQIDYTLTVDGALVDSSKGRGPLSYVHGQNQIIPGLERRLTGLQIGEARQITVGPEEGYGPVDPNAFVEVSREQLPPEMTPEIGQVLQGTDQGGRPFRATINKVGEATVLLNLNHPLAGKTLLFDITVVDIRTTQ